MGFMDAMRDFFYVMDWKLVVAGFVMLAIFLLVVYLIFLVALSFLRRREKIDVSLPDIDNYDELGLNTEKFNEPRELEVELIEDDTVNIGNTDVENDEYLFLTALSLEAKKYIPSSDLYFDMPKIGELDIDAIKFQKSLKRVREIAKEDDKEIIHENFINEESGEDSQ